MSLADPQCRDERITRLLDWQKTLGVVLCLSIAGVVCALLQTRSIQSAAPLCMVTAAAAFIAMASLASVEQRIHLRRQGHLEPASPFRGIGRVVAIATLLLLLGMGWLLPHLAPLLAALLLFGALAERFERRPPAPSKILGWLRVAALFAAGLLIVLSVPGSH